MLIPIAHAPHFSVGLQPSRYLQAFVLVVHFVLLLCLPTYDLPQPLKFAAALIILVSAGFSHWRLNDARCPLWIEQIEGGSEGFRIFDARGRQSVVLEGATVWRWLIVLNLRDVDSGRRHSVVVFPDSCDRDQRRQLRVFLRHCVTAAS